MLDLNLKHIQNTTKIPLKWKWIFWLLFLYQKFFLFSSSSVRLQFSICSFLFSLGEQAVWARWKLISRHKSLFLIVPGRETSGYISTAFFIIMSQLLQNNYFCNVRFIRRGCESIGVIWGSQHITCHKQVQVTRAYRGSKQQQRTNNSYLLKHSLTLLTLPWPR